MESYGTLLRQAREAKKIDISRVERETSISRQYIEALENENTAAFHGEAYLIGFLKNYAEYLELDSEKLLHLYHNVVIQESPVPEGLIQKPRPAYFVPAIVGGIILAIALALLIVYFTVIRKEKLAKQHTYAISEKVQQKVYELSDKPMNTRVYVGDQILVPSHGGNIILTVASDTDSKLGLQTPQGLQYFELSETRELDIDGDNLIDLIIDVWEISSNSESRGAEVYIMIKDENFIAESVDTMSIPLMNQENKIQTMILEDNRAYPFTLNASFRNPCIFRYVVDRRDSVENYYTNGDVVTMTANNKVRVWISNGNTVKFQLVAASQTYELEIGKAGEVIVQDIKWIRTDSGRYQLVVENID